MTCASCEACWRIELADLRTGRVRAVVTPLSFDFQTALTGHGQGSMIVATCDVAIRDIWPHLTVAYFLRTCCEDTSTADPIAEFAAMIEAVDAGDDGTTNIGFVEITDYINRRHLDTKVTYNQQSQTSIAADLVNRTIPDGIQLSAVAAQSFVLRDRTYEAWDRKNIGEAVQQLSEVIDGPEWEVSHLKSDGEWRTLMTFRDEVGVVRDVTLRSNVEAAGYGITVDASQHATHVDGIGAGEEQDMLIATAEDLSVYPRFDAAPAWKDVSLQNTLQEHTDGYLQDHKEPYAAPRVTVAGCDPLPSLTRLGDTVNVDVNYCAVTYRGPARIISVAWSMADGQPLTRTIEFQPIGPASESVLNQRGTEGCVDCG